MLKLKLQYFGHLIWRIESLEKTWCWERLKVGGEGDHREWVGLMASPTGWTLVWVSSGSWWWTGKPGMLQSMGSQRVGHDWATELNWKTNKAREGDGIPAELYQILKDDAGRLLYSLCQQIWKTQQWPQDCKKSVFTPIPKKGNAKECKNYCTIALISHASKIMLKTLQARFQQYINGECPDVQAGFRKGRGTRGQTAIRWS